MKRVWNCSFAGLRAGNARRFFIAVLLCFSLSAGFPFPAYAQQAEENPYLRLINWHNAYTGDDYTLTRLDRTIEKNLVVMDGGNRVEPTAGAAANAMFLAAKEQGVEKLVIDNVYRSVAQQTGMWNRRVRRQPDYGENPYKNPVSVMPGGMSEHATGLALDILSKSHNRANSAFGETEAGEWLAANAHVYGFILRYPKGKEQITGVIYEPWHFRYVGAEAAAEMYQSGLCLEEYWEECREASSAADSENKEETKDSAKRPPLRLYLTDSQARSGLYRPESKE